MFKFLLILLIAAAPAGAQMYLGAGPGADSLTKEEKSKLNRQDEERFARAFALENSTAALYAVFESTAPARAAASYMRRGIYRQELLILYAIARDAKTTFKALFSERAKGVSLQDIARRNKADLMKLFLETGEFQKKIELSAAAVDVSTASFSDEVLSPPAGAELSTAPVSLPQNEKK